MKKNGFTLAEVLIALTVVGVVAALVAPMLGNIMPNKDKVRFLKVYDSIATAASDIIDNSEYYYGTSTRYAGCMGFACDNEVKNIAMLSKSADQYKGIAKHQCLIADILSPNSSCNSNNATNTFSPISGINVTMTTTDVNSGNYLTNITINLGKDNKGNNKIYYAYMDNWGRLAPGRFAAAGSTITVTPDTMAQAYLENRLKLNNKTEDKQIASKYSTTPQTINVTNYGAIKIQ